MIVVQVLRVCFSLFVFRVISNEWYRTNFFLIKKKILPQWKQNLEEHLEGLFDGILLCKVPQCVLFEGSIFEGYNILSHFILNILLESR